MCKNNLWWCKYTLCFSPFTGVFCLKLKHAIGGVYFKYRSFKNYTVKGEKHRVKNEKQDYEKLRIGNTLLQVGA